MNKTLRRVRLVVDDVVLGGFVRLDERPEGLAFVGDGAVRIIAGGRSAEFAHDRFERMLVVMTLAA